MTSPSKTLALFAGVLSLACFTSTARAEDVSFHLQGGLEQPITDPQQKAYEPGAVLNASLLFPIFTPNLAVGPAVSGAYMSKKDNSNAGTVLQFGGVVRLQGDRNVDADVSPYLEGEVSYAHTGDESRPAVDLRIGMDFFTDAQNSASTGLFFGFTHIFQTSTTDGPSPLLNSNDYNSFQFGLSESFDFPVNPRVETKIVHNTVVRYVPRHCPTCETKPVATPEVVIGRVYFNWDSPVIRNWEESDKILDVVAKLNKFPNATVRVQGHASSDGQHAHNVALAEKRTAAVVAYLVSHGVAASRITSESYGPDMPFTSNDKQEGRERNRRVQFEFTVSQ